MMVLVPIFFPFFFPKVIASKKTTINFNLLGAFFDMPIACFISPFVHIELLFPPIKGGKVLRTLEDY